MNVSQSIIESARIFPGETAIVFGSQKITFGELEDLSARAATILEDAGIATGDRVALHVANVPAFPVWYYAALRLGAIAVSINTRLAAEEAEFIVADCGARVLIVSGETQTASSAQTIPVSEDGLSANGASLGKSDRIGLFASADMAPSDPAIILYTSGTTGFPKGATLSHENIRATVHAFNHLCGMNPGDRLLLTVPLFHCYGQNALLNAGLNIGATLILQRRFDLNEAKQLIRDHRVNKLFGVPTTFQLMLEACDPDELDSIGYCFSAAATLAPQLGKAWFDKFGLPIYEGYGLTETAPFASYNHRLKHIPGSIGMPVDLVEMKVVDPETGETCPPGVPGEIAVRGPNVMLGYWNRPEETAQAVREGWFYSGDVGKVDEQGFFYIVDRIKDMIAVGGMKVFPSEVERVLLDAPGVADCAVVGLPDPIWGEEVVAFVVPGNEQSPDRDAIRAHCLSHLAAYKTPARIFFVEELPRNPAGKVLKKELRAFDLSSLDEQAGETSVAKAEMPEEDAASLFRRLRDSHASMRRKILTDRLQEEIRTLTGSAEPPSLDAGLLETGMDSIMMVSLATRLQHQLGPQVELPATLVFDYPRIQDLASYLLTALEFETRTPASAQPFAEQRDRAKISKQAASSLDEMSEEEAMAALLEELKD